MKLLILLSSILVVLTSHSALYDIHQEVQEFTFQAASERFTVSAKAESHEQAFELAAMKCMDYVATKYGSSTEEKKMDIIDVCANPVR